MGKFREITGKRFGRLTVIEKMPTGYRDQVHYTFWRCHCACGRETFVVSQSLTRGLTKSCGCLRRETIPDNRVHGMSRTRTYAIWASMHQRCLNPNTESFANYGGRGIKVCKRWQTFENFFANMGERPPNRSLDRINNDGDYKPSNCRWATVSEQNKNSRRLIGKSSQIITAMGETLTVAQWARKTGIKPMTLYWRVKQGWLPEKILQKR